MSLLGFLAGHRKNLPSNRNEKTLYACIDGGLYLGPHLIAERNNHQLGIATYRAVRLSETDKLIVAQLNSQGSVDLTRIANGTMIVVINPEGLYASPGVTRIEDESNLDSIRKYVGLLSWKSCNTYGVDIPSPGGDLQSRQLDMKYDLQDYVRLSFCEDHPMAYRHKKDGKRLVLLKIKTDVALWERTLFSDINATDSNHHVGGTLYDLKRVNFVAVKKTYVSRDDNDFKHHQAEILVKTVIPKEFIVNLDNPEYIR